LRMDDGCDLFVSILFLRKKYYICRLLLFICKTMKAENLIMKRTMEFSISAVSYSEKLESERKYVIAKQFLRCSTSIGANVREAQEAESKADFIHKMSISLKEANETLYWIEI